MSDAGNICLEDKLMGQVLDTMRYLGLNGDGMYEPWPLRYFCNVEADQDGHFLRLFLVSETGNGVGHGYRPKDYGYADMQGLSSAVSECLACNGIRRTKG